METLSRLLADTQAGADQYWIFVGLAMLLASYMIMRPKKKRKDPLASPPRSSLSQQRSVEREMQNLLVELSQMAQQISAQIDTRSAKLEALIKEADEKIAQLSAANSKAPAGLRLVQDEEVADSRYQEIYAMADKGARVMEIAQKFGKPSGEIELILALRPGRNRRIEERHEA